MRCLYIFNVCSMHFKNFLRCIHCCIQLQKPIPTLSEDWAGIGFYFYGGKELLFKKLINKSLNGIVVISCCLEFNLSSNTITPLACNYFLCNVFVALLGSSNRINLIALAIKNRIWLDIRKSRQTNKFWVHSVDINESANGVTFADSNKANNATFKTVGTFNNYTSKSKKSQEKSSDRATMTTDRIDYLIADSGAGMRTDYNECDIVLTKPSVILLWPGNCTPDDFKSWMVLFLFQ